MVLTCECWTRCLIRSFVVFHLCILQLNAYLNINNIYNIWQSCLFQRSVLHFFLNFLLNIYAVSLLVSVDYASHNGKSSQSATRQLDPSQTNGVFVIHSGESGLMEYENPNQSTKAQGRLEDQALKLSWQRPGATNAVVVTQPPHHFRANADSSVQQPFGSGTSLNISTSRLQQQSNVRHNSYPLSSSSSSARHASSNISLPNRPSHLASSDFNVDGVASPPDSSLFVANSELPTIFSHADCSSNVASDDKQTSNGTVACDGHIVDIGDVDAWSDEQKLSGDSPMVGVCSPQNQYGNHQ